MHRRNFLWLVGGAVRSRFFLVMTDRRLVWLRVDDEDAWTLASIVAKGGKLYAVREKAPAGVELEQAVTEDELATLEIVPCDAAKLSSLSSSHCTCAICHEDFAVGDKLRCLPSCEHHYHAGCIGHWLRIKAACPLCNAKVRPAPATAAKTAGR